MSLPAGVGVSGRAGCCVSFGGAKVASSTDLTVVRDERRMSSKPEAGGLVGALVGEEADATTSGGGDSGLLSPGFTSPAFKSAGLLFCSPASGAPSGVS